MNKLIDTVRVPVQKRSQERVQLILEAARDIIAVKGCAGMKVMDIAQAAEISVGSIYQYFPNKRSIIAALAESLLEENTQKNADILKKKPRSLVELAQLTTNILDQYYEFRIRNEVAKEIWAGYAADKELRVIEENDSLINRDHMFEMSKHLFRPETYEEARSALLVIIWFGGSTVELASQKKPDEGKRIMEQSKTMLLAAWQASLMPLSLE